jgi:hypothetical protein
VEFASWQEPFEPVNVLEREETGGEPVWIGARERLVEGRGGFGGGSVVYHPVQFLDREITERNRITTNE